MILVDDLLLAPVRGLVWIAEKVRDAARQDLEGEAREITDELRQLYLALEARQITEADFDSRERELLDRYDAICARRSAPHEERGRRGPGHTEPSNGEPGKS